MRAFGRLYRMDSTKVSFSLINADVWELMSLSDSCTGRIARNKVRMLESFPLLLLICGREPLSFFE